jgi:cell wall-associated NlpC family hydrolase
MFLPPSRSPGSSLVRLAAPALLLAALLTGCGGHSVYPVDRPAPQPPNPPLPGVQAQARSVGERAAVVAVRQVGVPYRYGGNSVSGYDCSGLVQYAYANAGKHLPRTSADLWSHARPVPREGLEVGDVLFFDIEGKVAHVGLYLGQRRFVHAPASGREVTIEDLDSAFYRQAFVRGGRP